MSAIPHSLVAVGGGALAGLALAAGLLWRQQRALRRARFDANHDDTTGLPNRRAVLDHLHRALARPRPVGLVLLDLDRFKTINDTYGHDAGNDVLTTIGRRLAAQPHPVVLAARLSGDEFALVVDGDTDQVQTAAKAALDAIAAAPVAVGTARLPVQASVGYASARPGTTPRRLLCDADEAMYQAKTTGSGLHGHPARPNQPDHYPRRRRRDRHHP